MKLLKVIQPDLEPKIKPGEIFIDRCEPQSTRPRVIDFDQVIEFEFAGCVNDLIK
jgi:hypothetical protein